MSQPEQRLALALIRSHFGDVPLKICTHLASGRLSFVQLGRASHLRVSQLQSGLVALVQHHVVRCAPLSALDPTLMYELDVQATLLRARFPRCLAHVAQRFGELGEHIVREVLLHGRIRLSHMMQNLRTALPSLSAGEIFAKFEELVSARMLARIVATAGSDQQYAIPAACRALGSGAKRPRDEPEDVSRKKVRLESGPASTDDDSDKGEYWRVDLRQINRGLRNEWIVTLFQQKIDAIAARIVRAMLARTLTNPLGSMTAYDIRVSLPELTEPLVQSYMMALCQDQSGLVLKTGDEYSINFAKCVALARRLAVEQYVSDRFGAPHARLFRVVNSFTHMGREQIARIAMVATFKETKIMLNQLFRAGLISVREVPKGPDRKPSNCHFLWSSNLDTAAADLLRTTLASMANLASRRHQEETTHARLLSKSQHLATADGEQPEDYRSNAEKQLAGKVSHGLDKLERAMLQVIIAIVLVRKLTHGTYRWMHWC
eukprot:m.62531 g.62531  ORF g.62531 m.62531 type:complete len:490 (+) comp12412_c0_seq4:154-1623(+)